MEKSASSWLWSFRLRDDLLTIAASLDWPADEDVEADELEKRPAPTSCCCRASERKINVPIRLLAEEAAPLVELPQQNSLATRSQPEVLLTAGASDGAPLDEDDDTGDEM